MEFIALLTTGRRYEQVLADQVAALRMPGRELQRTLARIVTAAHSLGVPVPAASLPLAVDAQETADAVGDALQEFAPTCAVTMTVRCQPRTIRPHTAAVRDHRMHINTGVGLGERSGDAVAAGGSRRRLEPARPAPAAWNSQGSLGC